MRDTPSIPSEMPDVAEPSSQLSPAMQEWRRGWPSALAASTSSALCISLWPAVSSLFIQPLHAAFGWSRSEIAFAYNASIAAAFAAPMFGRLIDRAGARNVLTAAMLVYAAGYLAFAAMPGSLGIYYIVFLVTATVGICTSGLGFTKIVAGAFVHSRGLALAVTRAGFGVSGAVMPPVLFAVISHQGWRAGFVLLAALIAFVALPVTLFGTRRARTRAVPAERTTCASEEPSLVSLLTDRRVLTLGLAAGLSYGAVIGLLQQLQPLLVGKGLVPESASYMIGLLGASALVGALASGVLLDRSSAATVGAAFTAGPALGCMLLLSNHLSFATAVPALVLIGLAQGAELDIVGYLTARHFSLRSYSSVYGFAILAISVGSAIFANVVAQLYDRTGDYQASIVVCLVSFLAASACYLAMTRFPAANPD